MTKYTQYQLEKAKFHLEFYGNELHLTPEQYLDSIDLGVKEDLEALDRKFNFKSEEND